MTNDGRDRAELPDDDWPAPAPWLSFAIVGVVILAVLVAVSWSA